MSALSKFLVLLALACLSLQYKHKIRHRNKTRFLIPMTTGTNHPINRVTKNIPNIVGKPNFPVPDKLNLPNYKKLEIKKDCSDKKVMNKNSDDDSEPVKGTPPIAIYKDPIIIPQPEPPKQEEPPKITIPIEPPKVKPQVIEPPKVEPPKQKPPKVEPPKEEPPKKEENPLKQELPTQTQSEPLTSAKEEDIKNSPSSKPSEKSNPIQMVEGYVYDFSLKPHKAKDSGSTASYDSTAIGLFVIALILSMSFVVFEPLYLAARGGQKKPRLHIFFSIVMGVLVILSIVSFSKIRAQQQNPIVSSLQSVSQLPMNIKLNYDEFLYNCDCKDDLKNKIRFSNALQAKVSDKNAEVLDKLYHYCQSTIVPKTYIAQDTNRKNNLWKSTIIVFIITTIIFAFNVYSFSKNIKMLLLVLVLVLAGAMISILAKSRNVFRNERNLCNEVNNTDNIDKYIPCAKTVKNQIIAGTRESRFSEFEARHGL